MKTGRPYKLQYFELTICPWYEAPCLPLVWHLPVEHNLNRSDSKYWIQFRSRESWFYFVNSISWTLKEIKLGNITLSLCFPVGLCWYLVRVEQLRETDIRLHNRECTNKARCEIRYSSQDICLKMSILFLLLLWRLYFHSDRIKNNHSSLGQ